MPSDTSLRLPALDPETVEPRLSTVYPAQFADITKGREKRALGNPLGLTQFGVNLTTLAPGAASALRHYHRDEDEFVFIVEGEATLITDAGEQILGPGMAAGFPAGTPDGHHLVNRSNAPVRYLEVGTRAQAEYCVYPDVDLIAEKRDGVYRLSTKDGTPY